ncbi:hypothetical protein MtrunA17_Chr0c12g0493671 [Medicago truncatula]|uniref:Uncharacterized protein n=1 Tax=Medicago truncatula TaxID=3880 RepID=A0A396G9C2_MEDTR|nr:hypothetical protein MtrunA17_Chr0c12g0493671 [Medicago truncatula]
MFNSTHVKKHATYLFSKSPCSLPLNTTVPFTQVSKDYQHSKMIGMKTVAKCWNRKEKKTEF